MKVIGITGGVGSGKSALLACLAQKYNCRVILADEVAHQSTLPGGSCYEKLIELLSEEILAKDGSIDRAKMSAKIFASNEVLEKVNQIIHPAVKKSILSEIATEKKVGRISFLFIEAALLIEDGYLNIVDEMWYIYTDKDVRRQRLKESRNYSDEKIESIMKNQLSEEEFRRQCKIVIDNSGNLAEACEQIDLQLERLRFQA